MLSARVGRQGHGPGCGRHRAEGDLNIGVIEGGLKVNMVPQRAGRGRYPLPLGVTREQVMAVVHRVLAGYPQPPSRK